MVWVAREPILKLSADPYFIYEFVERLQAELARTFRNKVADFAKIDWKALEKAIADGDVWEAERAFPWREWNSDLSAKFADIFEGGIMLSGEATLGQEAMGLNHLEATKRATDWAERYAAKLVTEVSDESKAALRRLITSELKAGIHPVEQIRDIRQMVGLTERQVQAGINYRAALEKKGYAPERVDRLMAKFTEGQHKWRAENIARTETMRALNQGQTEAWLQAADAGYLDEETTLRKWILGSVERSCVPCRDMAGTTATLRGTFPNGSAGPPLHPSCKCVTGLYFLD